jgi:hypothetical protein
MADAKLIDLIEGLQSRVEEAYQRGVAAGRQIEREALLAYLQNGEPGSQSAEAEEAGGWSALASDPKRTKAPRGLINTVLRDILTESPGMPLPQVEEAVTAREPRIAKKTVYNHLNANRDTLYRYTDGRWYLLEAQSVVRPAWTWPPNSAGGQ